MNEHPYSAFCLRYYPSLVSGEFVNVGVALVSRRGRWAVRIAEDLRDLRCLFPAAQPKALKRILAEIRERLVGEPGPSLILEPATVEDPLSVIRRRTGNLNGSIRWSDAVFEGSTGDLEAETSYWFEQLIQAAESGETRAPRSAAEGRGASALRTIMEEEFIRRGIIGRLRSRRIEGYSPTTLTHTYENGRLNIFEPISLNYRTRQTIISHAERWRGRLDVISDQTNKPLAFFTLVELPDLPDLRFDVEAALTMLRRAQVERVETVPSEEVEHFGALVVEAIGEDANGN